jgi:hypothetical protein
LVNTITIPSGKPAAGTVVVLKVFSCCNDKENFQKSGMLIAIANRFEPEQQITRFFAAQIIWSHRTSSLL